VKFTENNDWEGETWHFWLQCDGNATALARLLVALHDTYDEDPEYTLDLDNPTDEATVDTLVEHAEGGYMASQNKVVGTLTLPEVFDFDDFYKGGIRDYFKVSNS
jgi:hypothetical protein